MRLRAPPQACASVSEGSATFQVGGLFYRPSSRLIRDLGVLALAILARDERHAGDVRVLDAMSGTGVRSLRYWREANATHIHANELMFGEHPLRANLAPLVEAGRGVVTCTDAVELYMRAKIDERRYSFIDADAFGTGQPHTA